MEKERIRHILQKMKRSAAFILAAVMFIGGTPVTEPKEVKAASLVQEITQGELITGYQYNIKFVKGITKPVPINLIENGAHMAYPWRPGAYLQDSQKGKIGMRYENVGRYNKTTLDLKITAVDWDTFSENHPNLRPAVQFATNAVKVNLQCVRNVRFRFEFFKSGTNEPVQVQGHGTLFDLDAEQAFTFYPTNGIDSVYILRSNEHLSANGNTVNSSTASTTDDMPEGWVTINYNSAAFELTFTDNHYTNQFTENGGNRNVVFGFNGFYSLGKYELEPPEKYCDVEDITDVENYSYTIYQNVQSRIQSTYLTKFIMTDVLEECLAADRVTVTNDENEDVTGYFDIKIDKNKVTATSKRVNLADFYGQGYYFKIDVHVRPEADLTPYLTEGRKFVIPNFATVTTNEASQKTDQVDVYGYLPYLEIQKTASQYEWQVGEDVAYTVEVTQTTEQATAKHVVVQDISLPEGLKVQNYDLSGPQEAAITPTGTGFTVSSPTLKYNEKIIVNFSCKAEESVNGKETVNTATTDADYIPELGDDAEVYVNTAKLTLDKSVTNVGTYDDDQSNADGILEFEVGDVISYHVRVENTNAGTIARDVEIHDSSLPEGLTFTGLEGLSIEGLPDTISYPVSGTSDTVHGEKEERPITCEKIEKGTGWAVKINYLPAATPVTISYQAKATEAVNGMEVINRAHAQAVNSASCEDMEKVYINTAHLALDKKADKEIVKVGDIITYTIGLTNTKTGTVAKQLYIADAIETEGVKLQKSSIVLMDEEEKVIPADKYQIEIKGNAFKLTLNDTAYLLQEGNYYIVDTEKGEPEEQEIWNPYDIQREQRYTVEYQAAVVDKTLAGAAISNTAVAKAGNSEEVEDKEVINPNAPNLTIEKSSDKSVYAVGETGNYKLTVRQNREDAVAKNIVIQDILATEGAEIVEGSLVVKCNNEDVTEQMEVTLDSQSFVIKTGMDMTDKDVFTVQYQVLFSSADLKNQSVKNKAIADADNADPKEDDHEVTVDEGTSPRLNIKKEADKSQYLVGETGTYTITVIQDRANTSAENVTLTDTLDTQGAELIAESIVLQDMSGGIVQPVSLTAETNGFTMETGLTLQEADKLTVTYQVIFKEESLKGKEVTNVAVATGVTPEGEQIPSVMDDVTVNIPEDEPEPVETPEPTDEPEPTVTPTATPSQTTDTLDKGTAKGTAAVNTGDFNWKELRMLWIFLGISAVGGLAAFFIGRKRKK